MYYVRVRAGVLLLVKKQTGGYVENYVENVKKSCQKSFKSNVETVKYLIFPFEIIGVTVTKCNIAFTVK